MSKTSIWTLSKFAMFSLTAMDLGIGLLLGSALSVVLPLRSIAVAGLICFGVGIYILHIERKAGRTSIRQE